MLDYKASFVSAIQALVIMRDALTDHGLLVASNRGFLGSSLQGIVVAPGGTARRPKGVLIDSEMTEAMAGISESGKGPSIPRVFQSLGTLLAQKPDACSLPHVEHDYLDELETLFYAFSLAVMRFYGDGCTKPAGDRSQRALRAWPSKKPDVAYAAKRSLFHCKFTSQNFVRNIDASWGEPCRVLFEQYHDFIKWAVGEKIDIQTRMAAGDWVEGEHYVEHPFESIHCPESHYSGLKRCFDKAIATMASVFRPPMSRAVSAPSSIVSSGGVFQDSSDEGESFSERDDTVNQVPSTMSRAALYPTIVRRDVVGKQFDDVLKVEFPSKAPSSMKGPPEDRQATLGKGRSPYSCAASIARARQVWKPEVSPNARRRDRLFSTSF